jgi:predicted DNA binding protein
MDERFERAPVGVLEVTRDGTVRAMNQRASELLDRESQVSGEPAIDTVFPESVDASVPRAFDRSIEEKTTVEEYYPAIERWFDVTLVPVPDAIYLYVQDVTERHRNEQRVDEYRSDLERLSIINELISDILAELVAASNRDEIAETICTRLGETSIYDFAWLGERQPGMDEIEIRAASGKTGRTLKEIEACLASDTKLPETAVVDSGSPTIIQPVGDDESVPERVRRGAFADGLQSLMAIPLTYGSSVYGVVGVYTSEQDAFSERERESFVTLGEMAGFAVNATRHRNLLLSDSVVELRLRITDRSDPFVSVATGDDAKLMIDGVVPQDEDLLCYLSVEDAPVTEVRASLADTDGTIAARLVGEYDDGGSIEVQVDEDTIVGRLIAQGTTIRSATYDERGGRVVIELPPEEDVRRLADGITRDYEAEVVAKRDRERDVVTAQEFRDSLHDRLTDRQENALKTAFLADYFESPRESTAEEVAEALDITGPTLLHHLRAGQRKLMTEMFDVTGAQQPADREG